MKMWMWKVSQLLLAIRYELNPDVGYYFKQRGIASEAKRLLFGYLYGWYTFPRIGRAS